MLDGDSDVTTLEKEQILKACRMKQRREVITAKRATELLGISRPTLRAYVRQGLLTQINISSRKVRFAQEQVEQLASYGAVETRGEE